MHRYQRSAGLVTGQTSSVGSDEFQQRATGRSCQNTVSRWRQADGTRRQLASSARNSRSIAELLLVHHPAEHGRHPGALVEAKRAGVARRVGAESDAALATLPEAPERVAEERRTDALLAPRATCEERVDKAAAVRVARADRPGGDLVAGADDAPQRRVKALAVEVAL